MAARPRRRLHRREPRDPEGAPLLPASPRFRRVVRIGPVQVATYYDGRGREKHTAACTAPRCGFSTDTTAVPPPSWRPAPIAARAAEETAVTLSLPLVFVLGVIAWAAIKFLGVRMWVAVVIALFGFLLSQTFLAPAIESGTRSGVDVVDGTRH